VSFSPYFFVSVDTGERKEKKEGGGVIFWFTLQEGEVSEEKKEKEVRPLDQTLHLFILFPVAEEKKRGKKDCRNAIFAVRRKEPACPIGGGGGGERKTVTGITNYCDSPNEKKGVVRRTGGRAGVGGWGRKGEPMVLSLISSVGKGKKEKGESLIDLLHKKPKKRGEEGGREVAVRRRTAFLSSFGKRKEKTGKVIVETDAEGKGERDFTLLYPAKKRKREDALAIRRDSNPSRLVDEGEEKKEKRRADEVSWSTHFQLL